MLSLLGVLLVGRRLMKMKFGGMKIHETCLYNEIQIEARGKRVHKAQAKKARWEKE
jgi:hypothetical protein